MNEKKPLILVLEDFKKVLTNDISAGLSSGIPAYLVEDVLNGCLAEVLKLKVGEIGAAYKAQQEKQNNGE